MSKGVWGTSVYCALWQYLLGTVRLFRSKCRRFCGWLHASNAYRSIQVRGTKVISPTRFPRHSSECGVSSMMACQAWRVILQHITTHYYGDAAVELAGRVVTKAEPSRLMWALRLQLLLPDVCQEEAGHFPSTAATPGGRVGDTSLAEEDWRGQRHRTSVRKSDRFGQTDTAVTTRD
jgi:hypothetical protein